MPEFIQTETHPRITLHPKCSKPYFLDPFSYILRCI